MTINLIFILISSKIKVTGKPFIVLLKGEKMKKVLYFVFLLLVIVYAIPNIFSAMIIIWYHLNALLGIGFLVVAGFALIKLVQAVEEWSKK